jgi:uncharacterized protein YbjT (DUF2867 family)
MGATGHVGRVVAERLLKTGAQVRGIGRNSERLKGLVDQGAIPYTGAFDDVMENLLWSIPTIQSLG